MRIVATIILCLFMLSSCGKNGSDLSPALDLRQKLENGDGCSFRTEITADYGDRSYTFTMDCTSDAGGDLHFQLVKPETISGITGTISESGGKLEFDDQALLFEPLTHGQLTPVIGPWLLIKTITGGYIRSVSTQSDRTVITIDDTLGTENLIVLLTLQADDTPVYCEIFWNNRRILSLNISDFCDL